MYVLNNNDDHGNNNNNLFITMEKEKPILIVTNER